MSAPVAHEWNRYVNLCLASRYKMTCVLFWSGKADNYNESTLKPFHPKLYKISHDDLQGRNDKFRLTQR